MNAAATGPGVEYSVPQPAHVGYVYSDSIADQAGFYRGTEN